MKRKNLILFLAMCVICLMLSGAAVGEVTHTVTFSLNYMGAAEAIYQTVADGGTAEKEEAPVREGYTFTGWFTSKVCLEEFDFSAPITADTRIFAGWRQRDAVVTLISDGNILDRISVETGMLLPEPDAPAREGYEFTGWYADARGKRLFSFEQQIMRNTTLYAGWNQARAMVTFHLSEDEAETMSVPVGEKVTQPESDPIREDYAFDGWYADALLSELFDFSAPVLGDTNIYAGWKLTRATVTLNPNHDAEPGVEIRVEVGQKLVADNPRERYGYDFDAWYLDPACENPYDFSQEVSGNMTLFAGWTKHLFQVRVNLNDGTSDEEVLEVPYEEKLAELNDPVRESYTFIGWYVDESAKQAFSFETPITGDMTIYAGWQSAEEKEAKAEVMVTFFLNDGSDAEYASFSSKTGRKLASKLPEDPTREGYYFVGWASDPAGATPVDTSSARITDEMNLYAIWYQKYTFEAEYTQITGKRGQGYSNNVSGLDLIYDVTELDNGTELGISNDNYVGDLYYNGAFLEFDILADAEVKDAIVILRLSVELYDMYLNDSTWQVEVNGETCPYGNLVLEGAIPSNGKDAFGNTISGIKNKRPFEDYVLGAKIALREGSNIIRLVTNNSTDHGGTFNAETPLIDSLTICSPVKVSWEVCYPENVGQTMSDVKY